MRVSVIFCSATSFLKCISWLCALHTSGKTWRQVWTPIRHRWRSAGAASRGSILICMDYAVAFHGTESAREWRRRRAFVVERMVWDAKGCVLTVRCCSSGLVHSSYRLKGGKRDVGVAAMETKSAHTDNEIQGYISMQQNKNIRTRTKKCQIGLSVVTT